MRTRALIRALAVALLLLPLISAWCPSCLAGSCSMVTPEGGKGDMVTPEGGKGDMVTPEGGKGDMDMATAEAAGPGRAHGEACHAMDAGTGAAVAAAGADCCATAVGTAPPALGAPIVLVYAGPDFESAPGATNPVAPRLGYQRGEDHAPRPHSLPTPLYTLHSSLLL